MGTLVVRELAARHPDKVSALVLLGAVREPAEAGRQAQRDRAAVLREKGTAAVAPGVVANALSETTRRDRPEVAAFVRELVMRQDPEGYARNCEALAAATDPGPIAPGLPLLLITGADDKVGPPEASQEIAQAHGRSHRGDPARRRALDRAGSRRDRSPTCSRSSSRPTRVSMPSRRRGRPDMPVPTNKTLFRNVVILDSTGADPYPGDVLVDNDRIAAVGTVDPPTPTAPGSSRAAAAP